MYPNKPLQFYEYKTPAVGSRLVYQIRDDGFGKSYFIFLE